MRPREELFIGLGPSLRVGATLPSASDVPKRHDADRQKNDAWSQRNYIGVAQVAHAQCAIEIAGDAQLLGLEALRQCARGGDGWEDIRPSWLG